MNTENNKIIAEFMGVSKSKIDANGQVLNFENSKYNRYNSDWNWLMEVVEKIERLEDLERFEITNHSVNITYYQSKENKFILNLNHRNNGLYLMGGENTVNTKIQAVYSACLEFIKWYNEQII